MITVEGCANGFPDMNLIIKRASRATSQATATTSGLSLLNRFTCRGTLTGLVLGVDVRTETVDRNQYPEVALWRPIDDDGGLVRVRGSNRTVRLTAANFSTSGVFDYPLDPPVNFLANDILSWQQPQHAKSVVRMYSINHDQQDFSSSDDDDPQGSSTALLLYPVAGEVQDTRSG